MNCWEGIVREWIRFWNEVRTEWYKRDPKRFGAKYNKDTKKWLRKGYLEKFRELLSMIKDCIGNLTVADAFENLRELFAIQYGIHEKWYAEFHKPKPVFRGEENSKTRLVQYLKYVMTVANFCNLDLNDLNALEVIGSNSINDTLLSRLACCGKLNAKKVKENLTKAWEVIKDKKVKDILGDWLLTYSPCHVNEGPVTIEVDKWSLDAFKKIDPCTPLCERRREMKKLFGIDFKGWHLQMIPLVEICRRLSDLLSKISCAVDIDYEIIFTPFTFDELSKIKCDYGVYIISRIDKSDEEIVYVGCSEDVARRLKQFKRQFIKRDENPPHRPAGYCGKILDIGIDKLRIHVICTKSLELAELIERLIIYLYKDITGEKPICNKR